MRLSKNLPRLKHGPPVNRRHETRGGHRGAARTSSRRVVLGSEEEFQTELDDARLASKACYSAEIRVSLLESAIRLFRKGCSGTGIAKLAVIEGIYKIGAEPDPVTFTPPPVLVQRDIPVVYPWPIDDSPG